MKIIFADTFYWVALINPKDQWHQRVKLFSRFLDSTQIITTDEILTEVLTFFSGYESEMRQKTSQTIHSILNNPDIKVIPQTHDSFLTGLKLYENRLDKEYSLTDCSSMCVMQKLGITEVLTHDKHFAQEGFVVLFNDDQ
jgi:predicted nucleic acid-binding protein